METFSKKQQCLKFYQGRKDNLEKLRKAEAKRKQDAEDKARDKALAYDEAKCSVKTTLGGGDIN